MARKEPSKLMQRAANTLFPGASREQDAFLSALLEPAPRGNAVVWTGPDRDPSLETMPRSELPGWLPESIDLLPPGTRPGLSSAHEKGQIYSLDLSSAYTGSALLETLPSLPESPRILDACAAPGGKSILASVFLRPAFLLANEVEGKRLGMLRHNLGRCHIRHAYTQKMSVVELATLAPRAFDLCLVDAPCSGQSLLAKGQENPGCFHPSVVKGNARRQRGILVSASQTVAPGGFLFYSTCTFSVRENEGPVEKLLDSQPDFSPVSIPHLAEFQSPFASWPAYRIYPHLSPGAGGFVCLLRREGTVASAARPPLAEELLRYPVTMPEA